MSDKNEKKMRRSILTPAILTIIVLSLAACCTPGAQTSHAAETGAGTDLAEEKDPDPAPAAEKTDSEETKAPTNIAGAENTLPVNAEFSGCLTEARAEEKYARATRLRGMEKPNSYTMTPRAGGLEVRQHINHSCCLKASVEAKIEGPVLHLTCHFSGQPCRCRCASTVNSTIDLPAGKYKVLVEHDIFGTVTMMHSQEVEIAETP